MALGFLIVVALAASTLRVIEHSRVTRAWVDHTYAVQDAIARLRADLHAAESARRGLLLDPDPALDAAYRKAGEQVPRDLDRLRALSADSPEQFARLSRFEALLVDHVRAQSTSIVGVRIGARAPAVEAFGRDGSGSRIQALEQLLTEMSQEAARLLRTRAQEEAASQRLLVAYIMAGVLLIAVLGLLSIGAYARNTAALERSRDRLHRFNEELERAVAGRTADLEQANAEIQRFAHLISHDLRAPLVNIVGFTNELKRVREDLPADGDARTGNLDANLSEAIHFIEASTEKMDRLIKSILRMAREGRRILTPQRLDMNRLIGGLLDSMRHQAGERNVELLIEGDLPEIVCDRLAIEQVFGNLIDNAIKYSKGGEPGRVVVRARSTDAWVEYEVEDCGVGIAPADQARIFDMFRRAGPSEAPGEGVGLAYARQIVRRLGGDIGVNAAAGEGATFRVSLPRVLTVAGAAQ
jgi:signal transduction histidine kinase